MPRKRKEPTIRTKIKLAPEQSDTIKFWLAHALIETETTISKLLAHYQRSGIIKYKNQADQLRPILNWLRQRLSLDCKFINPLYVVAGLDDVGNDMLMQRFIQSHQEE